MLYFAALVYGFQTLISDIDTFTLALFIVSERPEILSNHSSVLWLACHEYLPGGQQQFFIIVFFSIRYQTLISDINTFLLALFIVSLDLKSKVIKVLFIKAVVL